MTINNSEILGRLLLWDSALLETQLLLNLASRARKGANQLNIIEQDNVFYEAERDFKSTIPKNENEQTVRDMEIFFFQSHPRIFPTVAECYSIHNNCILLAVIFFCQIFNQGRCSSDTIASNTNFFRDTHLEHLLNLVFPNPNQKKKFESLKSILTTARDKMIAHADGSEFDMTHDNFLTSWKLPSSIIDSIDVIYWISILDPIRTNLLQYYSELKKSSEK